jgi:serine/threonine-protein kinase
MLGRVLADRYRILRRIGEGGMGAVYLCEHVVLHRPLAVKVLRRELSSDPEIVERFRNEAIAASQIGQENVVSVFDIGRTDDGALYYVMEALEGTSVGAVLRTEGPLGVGRALSILEQVGRALGAAHARGVVHRDLKPDNVFVVRREDGSELAKLIDFGISKLEQAGERLTQAGTIIGTPEYMAPEQAAGAAVDHRADVYALGVMGYELLTGVLPFEGDTAIATLVAHQTRVVEPPSRKRVGIPPEVDALLMRALAKRPEDRFDSMTALVAEVARIRAALGPATPEPLPPRRPDVPATARIEAPFRPSRRGETIALPPAATGVRMPPTQRTSPARLAFLSLVLVTLVAGAMLGGWWLRGIGEKGPPAAGPNPFPVAPGPGASELQPPGGGPAAAASAPVPASGIDAVRSTEAEGVRSTEAEGGAADAERPAGAARTRGTASAQDSARAHSAGRTPDAARGETAPASSPAAAAPRRGRTAPDRGPVKDPYGAADAVGDLKPDPFQ